MVLTYFQKQCFREHPKPDSIFYSTDNDYETYAYSTEFFILMTTNMTRMYIEQKTNYSQKKDSLLTTKIDNRDVSRCYGVKHMCINSWE